MSEYEMQSLIVRIISKHLETKVPWSENKLRFTTNFIRSKYVGFF